MAEAIAAADMAAQIRIRVETEMTFKTTDTEQQYEQMTQTMSLLSIPYTIREKQYNPETRTAYILLELPRSEVKRIIEDIENR
ncbi:hypothetical protein K7I13_14310 [Brucepastera parasyntrophica]|uniref:hypothetical protein n=1 Tax=Brucepastera parasyntrophica TaxID=2880008 RepID=UPI00210B11D9|nr:hypothetical protein [Brucepastera parasyntrophica]ULQ59614.1 hypothetical protein K7I13_14310 [Brucepastera parasyntrophica]